MGVGPDGENILDRDVAPASVFFHANRFGAARLALRSRVAFAVAGGASTAFRVEAYDTS